MNIALAGTTCGQLLTLFKFPFEYPKSQESKEREKQLEELERHFETEEELPDEVDTISKAQDQQEVAEQFATTSSEPKSKKQKFGQCWDLVPISRALPIMPSTTVKLSKTGVPRQSYSSHTKNEGQSIYRCLLKKPGSDADCTYYTAKMAAMCTHICCKHLKLCIKGRLCPKKSYSSTQISLHLKTIHHDQEGEWFEPTAPLEGDLAEVKTKVLAANLQEVEDATAEPDDDE